MKVLPLRPRISLRAALLALVCVSFALFLLSPSFVDAVKGDGTQTMRPGWTQVFWDALFLIHAWELHRNEFFHVVIISLPSLVAEAGFLLLPVLAYKKFYGRQWLRFGMAGVFFIGGTMFGLWVRHEISMNSHVGYGVWLWLMAAMLAVVYCLLKPSGSGKFDPLW